MSLVQVEHINFVLARHEQGAVHMAEGYARACGKVGTVAVTSGPGATNIVTGLADAIMDSVPIVAFTGQVPTPLIGSDAFQEADVTGITRSVTKHNYLVKDVRELAEVVKEAYYVARSGRPGPVLIDLPKDVTVATAPFEWPETVEMRSYRPTVDGHPKQIKKAAELIAKAERPVLYVGGGVIISEAPPRAPRVGGTELISPWSQRSWPWGLSQRPIRCASGCPECTGACARIGRSPNPI